jgi:hypothetical protein
MIKKFIIRGVSKKFTGIQKLKAQPVPKMERSGAEAAEAQFTKIFGDKPQFAGFSGSKRFGATATGTELAAKDLAVQTSEKSFFKILSKGLKRQSETKFIKKAYDTANIQSVGVYQRTLQKFTGKSGISPFVHKPTPLKFIKSKRFKKGLPTGVSGKQMGWAPKTYSKLERGAYGQKRRMAEFASQPKNINIHGEVNWKKFWKTEGPRQKSYIKYKRSIYTKHFTKKK